MSRHHRTVAAERRFSWGTVVCGSLVAAVVGALLMASWQTRDGGERLELRSTGGEVPVESTTSTTQGVEPSTTTTAPSTTTVAPTTSTSAPATVVPETPPAPATSTTVAEAPTTTVAPTTATTLRQPAAPWADPRCTQVAEATWHCG
jgi:cytoskeletal protein RodZ